MKKHQNSRPDPIALTLLGVEINMWRKILIAVLTGLLYWLTSYLVMKLFVILNLEYNNLIGILLYFVIPFFLGGILIIITKDRRFFGAAYSSIIIIVRYLIDFLEVTIRHIPGPSAFEQILFFFKVLGAYSIICAGAGGLIAVLINRRRHKSEFI
ncbi:MAG: hypothetical protein M0Z61_08575 [Nitrospiraceae bacterium]|nr:hypothetical protein [Nitrospiraceae bacterium]